MKLLNSKAPCLATSKLVKIIPASLEIRVGFIRSKKN